MRIREEGGLRLNRPGCSGLYAVIQTTDIFISDKNVNSRSRHRLKNSHQTSHPSHTTIVEIPKQIPYAAVANVQDRLESVDEVVHLALA